MELKVVGIDPSIRNSGIAIGRVLLPSLEIQIDDIVLAATDSQHGKQVRKNSDDLRRAQEIVTQLEKACEGAAFAITEVPTGAQSARAAWMLGMSVGILASLKVMRVPLIQVQPSETKIASIGKKTASKAEIIEWAVAKYPDAPWLRYKRHGEMLLTDSNEHLADAIAVMHAGILTNEFQQAIALMGGMKRAAA